MTDDKKNSKPAIYILLISIHGLIRPRDLELGRDADTGGQTTYVVELARALAKHREVDKVDLLTRLIDDTTLSPSYALNEESLGHGARIIRIPCGPKKYLRKESLWLHLDQMVDKCLHFFRQQGRLPDLIHSHYADAGYVGKQLSTILGIPLVHTGHSLGRAKRKRLIENGRKQDVIEKEFNFERRIAIEEDVIQHASMVVTSTRQEIDEQYGMYQNHDPKRCCVIPPGTDISRFSPPRNGDAHFDMQARIDRFLSQPGKPFILSISRPEERKNLRGLVAAYGESRELQEIANLVIVAGTRDDVRNLKKSERMVMTDLLFDIDRYDLWGKVAIPKHINQEDIPGLYRLAARRRGVFVNAALTEPFGLTLLEAAACGLPFVAPDDGGPNDIVANCQSGFLANTLDSTAIAISLHQVLSNKTQWRTWSKNGIAGIKRHYSWDAHVVKYMKEARSILRKNRKSVRKPLTFHDGKSFMPLVKKVIVSDIDNTLIGNQDGLNRLIEWLRQNTNNMAFGVATGRPLESAVQILKKHRVPLPDVFITSVGSEINYAPDLAPDIGWMNHIRYMWRRDELVNAMSDIPGLELQPEDNQREFKLSYFVNVDLMPPIKNIYRHLNRLNLNARVIYSHDQFLDLLPVRSSKGHAVRYLSYKWNLPMQNFLVAGDSGNDSEMLVGDTLGVVVGNHSAELESLRELEQVYFAQGHCAEGILEGITHYGFDQPCAPNEANQVDNTN